MKGFVFFLMILLAKVSLAQSPDYGDKRTRLVYNLGAGISSIGGIAAINELGINYNRNVFAWRLHFSSELTSSTSKTGDNDIFLSLELPTVE